MQKTIDAGEDCLVREVSLFDRGQTIRLDTTSVPTRGQAGG